MFGEMVPLDVGLHTQLAGLGGLLSDGDLSIAAWSDCCYDAHTHFAEQPSFIVGNDCQNGIFLR